MAASVKGKAISNAVKYPQQLAHEKFRRLSCGEMALITPRLSSKSPPLQPPAETFSVTIRLTSPRADELRCGPKNPVGQGMCSNVLFPQPSPEFRLDLFHAGCFFPR
jgi:hypothetical protein